MAEEHAESSALDPIEAYKMQNKRAHKLKEDTVIIVEMSDEPLPTEKRNKLKAKIEAKWTERY